VLELNCTNQMAKWIEHVYSSSHCKCGARFFYKGCNSKIAMQSIAIPTFTGIKKKFKTKGTKKSNFGFV
jgi:hypothetical protein